MCTLFSLHIAWQEFKWLCFKCILNGYFQRTCLKMRHSLAFICAFCISGISVWVHAAKVNACPVYWLFYMCGMLLKTAIKFKTRSYLTLFVELLLNFGFSKSHVFTLSIIWVTSEYLCTSLAMAVCIICSKCIYSINIS